MLDGNITAIYSMTMTSISPPNPPRGQARSPTHYGPTAKTSCRLDTPDNSFAATTAPRATAPADPQTRQIIDRQSGLPRDRTRIVLVEQIKAMSHRLTIQLSPALHKLIDAVECLRRAAMSKSGIPGIYLQLQPIEAHRRFFTNPPQKSRPPLPGMLHKSARQNQSVHFEMRPRQGGSVAHS